MNFVSLGFRPELLIVIFLVFCAVACVTASSAEAGDAVNWRDATFFDADLADEALGGTAVGTVQGYTALPDPKEIKGSSRRLHRHHAGLMRREVLAKDGFAVSSEHSHELRSPSAVPPPTPTANEAPQRSVKDKLHRSVDVVPESLMEASSVGAANVTASASVSLNSSGKAGGLPESFIKPRDITTSDGFCDTQETDMDDSMLGSIESFSRHWPYCHSDHVLRKWKLFMAGTITRYRIQYTCCLAMFVGNCIRNSTEWTAPRGTPSQTETYYKHKLSCYEKDKDPAEGHIVFVQRGFHQEIREMDKALRFEYWCCQIKAAGDCKKKETNPQHNGRGNVVFLERHELECGANEAISNWQLVPVEKNLMKFVYTCCPVDRDLPTAG